MDLALLAQLQNFQFADYVEPFFSQFHSRYFISFMDDVNLSDTVESSRLEYFAKVIKFFESLPKNQEINILDWELLVINSISFALTDEGDQ
jgi:hypothetical protein